MLCLRLCVASRLSSQTPCIGMSRGKQASGAKCCLAASRFPRLWSFAVAMFSLSRSVNVGRHEDIMLDSSHGRRSSCLHQSCPASFFGVSPYSPSPIHGCDLSRGQGPADGHSCRGASVPACSSAASMKRSFSDALRHCDLQCSCLSRLQGPSAAHEPPYHAPGCAP